MQQLFLTLRFYAITYFIISANDFARVSTINAHRVIHRVKNIIIRFQSCFIKFLTTSNERKIEQFYKISRFLEL